MYYKEIIKYLDKDWSIKIFFIILFIIWENKNNVNVKKENNYINYMWLVICFLEIKFLKIFIKRKY